MPLHLIKLCVGCATPEELIEWQDGRVRATIALVHKTRNMPRRAAEILNGGSLYWVFKGVIRARQKIAALERGSDDDGQGFCRIHLVPGLVRTHPKAHRPFQGWRYFSAEDAPEDTAGNGTETEALPEALSLELYRLGLV